MKKIMPPEYFKEESHVLTYNKFRPSPPKSLINEIINFMTGEVYEKKEFALDVGCGSGQSTEVLAPFFKKVMGLDSNKEILNEAVKNCRATNVFYKQCVAEDLNKINEKADLVTICQALHWMNIPKFYSEVDKILKSKGVFAVYGYSLPVLKIDGLPELENIVKKYYVDILKDYTLPQSKKAYLENYATAEFEEVYFVEEGKMKRKGNYNLEIQGTLTEVIGYMKSWSAFQNYIKHEGKESGEKLLKNFEDDIKSKFEKIDEQEFKILFQYFLLLGKKE